MYNIDLTTKTEKEKIIKSTFFRFLKNHNAYNQYIFNLKNRDYAFGKFNHINIEDGNRLISKAFRWSTTKEDFAYWLRLAHKWSEIWEKLKNK